MPRLIYKPSDSSPYTLINIDTGKTFSDERQTILPSDAAYPSFNSRKNASKNNWLIEIKIGSRGKSAGKSYWVPIKDPSKVLGYNNSTNPVNTATDSNSEPPEYTEIVEITDRDYSVKRQSVKKLLEKSHNVEIPEFDNDEAIIKLIENAEQLKPSFLKMENDSWKLLVRSALRAKNIVLLGDKGEGKTMTVHALKNALGRPFFTFNFGNMQDAQTALIGKTHLDMTKGTYFNAAEFVKAIQTEGAIILCDELTRMSEDASNILFSVFDENQRYLRMSESEKSDVINVAKGVCFVATANIGFQYTGTRKLDAAMFDRWTKIEVDHLSKEDRKDILSKLFPDLTDYVVDTIATIADTIRENYQSDDPKVNTAFSTRMCIALAELVYDGFPFLTAIEKTVYPEYSSDGGNESPRTFVKQVCQGLYDANSAEKPFKSQKATKKLVKNNKNLA